MLLLRRSLYQVVSPTSLFLFDRKILCPTVGNFPYRDKDARLAILLASLLQACVG